MYETTRCKLYGLHKSINVYLTVGDCNDCARNCAVPIIKHQLKLFRANWPLDIMSMHVMGLLPRTTIGIPFSIVICDPYTKIATAVLSWKNTALDIASLFLNLGWCNTRFPHLSFLEMVCSWPVSSSRHYIHSSGKTSHSLRISNSKEMGNQNAMLKRSSHAFVIMVLNILANEI